MGENQTNEAAPVDPFGEIPLARRTPNARLHLSDAEVAAICTYLRHPYGDIPVGAMKGALRLVGIDTTTLPDGTRDEAAVESSSPSAGA